ncbi:hypothetical protein CHS0354_043074 [Potamilus streckersoni]|uniref:Uncharacterized protein n=1 Tax=Potamilus streckersoni TaxID=2493646 RepID=A0AAE0SCX5_9BIVA|nr:hypothetical protein CHS0354_043074 [Potamilus streckersoni]
MEYVYSLRRRIATTSELKRHRPMVDNFTDEQLLVDLPRDELRHVSIFLLQSKGEFTPYGFVGLVCTSLHLLLIY